MKNYFIITLILVSIFVPVFAQNKIEIRDTAFQRGVDNKIIVNISGSISSNSTNSIKVQFRFNPKVININRAFGSADFIFQSAEPSLKFLSFQPDTAIIEVSEINFKPKNNSVILSLEVEGLASDDSLAFIEPIKLIINDSDFSDKTTFTKAIFKVTGLAIFPIYPENLEQNYPNPFDDYTILPFNINKDTKIEFLFYSDDGRLLQSSNAPDDIANFSVFGKSGVEISNFQSKVFSKGSYYLKINTIPWAMSTGIYYCLMKTNFSIYRTVILHCK